MNDNNFYKKSEEPMENQTVTLGEKEYTQEDLQRLVGLGETAAELESKWNTPVDRLMPAYTEATQQRAEYERRAIAAEARAKAFEDAQLSQKVATNGELTFEEQKRIAKQEAEKLDILTLDKFDELYKQRREQETSQDAANRLISETDAFIQKQVAEGKPKTSVQEMLTFMDENGVTNYESAYKLKYEAELDNWKMSQLAGSKPAPIYTQGQSTAGAKAPEERRINDANLGDAIKDVVSRFK